MVTRDLASILQPTISIVAFDQRSHICIEVSDDALVGAPEVIMRRASLHAVVERVYDDGADIVAEKVRTAAGLEVPRGVSERDGLLAGIVKGRAVECQDGRGDHKAVRCCGG